MSLFETREQQATFGQSVGRIIRRSLLRAAALSTVSTPPFLNVLGAYADDLPPVLNYPEKVRPATVLDEPFKAKGIPASYTDWLFGTDSRYMLGFVSVKQELGTFAGPRQVLGKSMGAVDYTNQDGCVLTLVDSGKNADIANQFVCRWSDALFLYSFVRNSRTGLQTSEDLIAHWYMLSEAKRLYPLLNQGRPLKSAFSQTIGFDDEMVRRWNREDKDIEQGIENFLKDSGRAYQQENRLFVPGVNYSRRSLLGLGGQN